MTKVERAIIFATNAHAGAKRKGKNKAYILHPLEVMVIVSGLTEDEDVLAAAVLHDTVEDAGVSLEEIRREFGERVAELVAAETEDKHRELPPEATWMTRKEAAIRHLGKVDRDAKLICLGDKLSNIREMSRDYTVRGDKLWEQFNQKRKALHQWYYSSIYRILADEFGDVPLIPTPTV